MTDPVHDLVHDHAEINRRVLALGAAIRRLQQENASSVALVDPLTELRELLFFHFAREEEGLFPYIAELVPDLADAVRDMAIAHDTICGALARMHDLASTASAITAIVDVFERFETVYASHSKTEASLLHDLSLRLDPTQRVTLASLIEGV